MGERTIFVEFMLGCLLDAMLNYKPEEDEDSEGVQDKIQDKLHDKFPELSEKSIKNALQKRAYRIKSFGI